jgi:hypothetical protein
LGRNFDYKAAPCLVCWTAPENGYKSVSVVDTTSFLYHRHNTFDKNYNKYRNDYEKDVEYIRQKSKRLIAEEKAKNATDNT